MLVGEANTLSDTLSSCSYTEFFVRVSRDCRRVQAIFKGGEAGNHIDWPCHLFPLFQVEEHACSGALVRPADSCGQFLTVRLCFPCFSGFQRRYGQSNGQLWQTYKSLLPTSRENYKLKLCALSIELPPVRGQFPFLLLVAPIYTGFSKKMIFERPMS